MDWRRELKHAAHANLIAPEQAVGRARYDAATAPYRIDAYRGFATANEVRVRGRVLGNGPMAGARGGGRWWNRLRRSLGGRAKRATGVSIELRYAGDTITVNTDDHGCYEACFPRVADAPLRCDAISRSDGNGISVLATHRLFSARDDSEYLVIGDIDDTIVHVGISELWTALRLAYLGHARTPKPLDGVAGLYRALQGGRSGAASNPIFYVSNCGWNLYGPLTGFIRSNELPDGPLFLRDASPDGHRAAPGEKHKARTIVRLLELFPGQPVVLIGDNGQRDPEIYSDIARNFPGRILAIYVRDPETGLGHERESVVEADGARALGQRVPLIRARDSRRFAVHMQSLGLLSASAYGSVAGSALRDQHRARAER